MAFASESGMLAQSQMGVFPMPVRLSTRSALLSLAAAAVLAAGSAGAVGSPGEGIQDVPIAISTISREEIEQGGRAIDVLTTLNSVRTNPQGFAAGMGSRPTIRGIGASDWNEARNYLNDLDALPPLEFSPALNDTALLHALDIGANGLTSHTGSNGSTLGGRIRDRGMVVTMPAEELSFGQTKPTDVIIQLIVDAGVPGKPHRRDLFNPVFILGGVGCARHTQHGQVCVINLSNAPMVQAPPTSLPPATPGFNWSCPAGQNPVELDRYRSQVFGLIRAPYNSAANRPWRDELSAANVAASLGYANPTRLDMSLEPRLTLPRNLGLGFGYCAPPLPDTPPQPR